MNLAADKLVHTSYVQGDQTHATEIFKNHFLSTLSSKTISSRSTYLCETRSVERRWATSATKGWSHGVPWGNHARRICTASWRKRRDRLYSISYKVRAGRWPKRVHSRTSKLADMIPLAGPHGPTRTSRRFLPSVGLTCTKFLAGRSRSLTLLEKRTRGPCIVLPSCWSSDPKKPIDGIDIFRHPYMVIFVKKAA